MGMTFTVEPGKRLVFTLADGPLRVADFAAHVQALADVGALGHSQLIDARSATLDITARENRNFAELMRRMRAVHGSTRTAFVVSRDLDYGLARMYEGMSAEIDPGFRVFRDLTEGRRWVFEALGGAVRDDREADQEGG
jgi:hypothetical protein